MLDRLVVTTPLRREASLLRSTSSVTVINEDDIAGSAAPDLPSLLKRYTGVSIIGYGGQGAASNVYLRGMSAGQTLVLVNGVRTASATSGTSSIFNIPLSSIELVEIAKGPHSAQYGADAIGGVINIITRQGGQCADGRNRCANVTTGVTHPWGGYVSGDLRGRTADGVDYAVGGSLLGTRGYDFTTPLAWGHEPDDDGFLQGALNFALAKDYGWGRFYADGLFARGRTQYDASFPGANEVDTDTFAGKIGGLIRHSDSWSSTLELTSSLDNSTNFRSGVAGDSEFDTKRHGIFASTEKNFDTGDVTHVVVGGAEAYRENVDSTVNFDVTSRNLAAVFGQYSVEYGTLTVDSGLRYDHNEQFGDATTYNIGASYEIVPDLVARVSYGTGFRAPTFNDLYYPNFSNPNLKPEKSKSYEVGFNWRPTEQTAIDAALYQTWLTDAIASNPPTYLPFNVARAKVTGFEATIEHAFDHRWSGKASIDYRSPKNEDTGRYIPYRDRFKAAAEVTFAATESLNLNAKLLYGAARFANAANTVKLPEYVTVDFLANYTFDARSSLKFSVENLLDEQYSTVTNYRAPGRTFNLSFTRVF
ncbi:TonB-dependent receptor [Aminobacter sp. AP02]|uniref:TonB-dependent receptor domain-containing protein n=1 Tax=Aminobacter sp. AP02 TaxID=2135737 RepID=UPI001FDF7525|nr:TonB-dependent receptor [Aminobacter sp. AP02]